MSSSHFNYESDYSEENASDSEDFRSTYLQPFQFEPEKGKSNGNREKATKHSHASRASVASIYQLLGLETCIDVNAGIAKKK